MSRLETVRHALSVVPLIFKVVFFDGNKYRSQRFGDIWVPILNFLVDTDTLQQRHWEINFWTDTEVIAWKNSHLAFCNAIAVAAAIFAGIGLTALQLPNMNTVHWSSRACCVSSMVLGILSLFTATKQHFTVGMLNSPLQIRLWLSRGRPESYRLSMTKIAHFTTLATSLSTDEETPNTTQNKYAKLKACQNMPLESSISALKAVALPSYLLELAVIVFLVGFGLFILFQWLEDVGGAVSYRNIFIVFIITVGLCVVCELLIEVGRVLDADKRTREFKTDMLGGSRKRKHLLALEQSLFDLQQGVEDEDVEDEDEDQPGIVFQRNMKELLEFLGIEQTSYSPYLGHLGLLLRPSTRYKIPSDPCTALMATLGIPAGSVPGPAPPQPSTTPPARQSPCQKPPATVGRIDPDPNVDKYQAWERYISSYIQQLSRTEPRLNLMKIMELKGSFEAEWDTIVTARETVSGSNL